MASTLREAIIEGLRVVRARELGDDIASMVIEDKVRDALVNGICGQAHDIDMGLLDKFNDFFNKEYQ